MEAQAPYRARLALWSRTDAALERAIQARASLAKCLEAVFPILLEATGGDAIWLESFDEELRPKRYSFRDAAVFHAFSEQLPPKGQPGSHLGETGDAVITRVLDVATQPMGWVALHLPKAPSDLTETEALLTIWSEAIDNHLGTIAEAREKHQLTRQTSRALRNPILEDGLDAALDVLLTRLSFEKLILIFLQDEAHDPSSLHFRVIDQGKTRHEQTVEAFVKQHASVFLKGDTAAFAAYFELPAAHHEVVITGGRHDTVVGRMMVSKASDALTVFERDILERFVDVLWQRVVDYNREWKHLSLCFSKPVVRRLLDVEDYRERYLRARQAELAILYADISGFTRLSEQVLKSPDKIAHLIHVWGSAVVQMIWDAGGVFDKIVGDCVIGLFGPPFYEGAPRDWCRNAAKAALQIRSFTQTLADDAQLPDLKDQDLGVSTGLNFTSASVGLIGPNENFTCMSSGMNNTARIQDRAGCNQIYCLEPFVRAYDEPSAFGEVAEVSVKNVAEPLRYRELIKKIVPSE